MQNSLLNSIRSLKLADGCRGAGSQLYANPSSSGHDKTTHHHRHHNRHGPSQEGASHLQSAAASRNARPAPPSTMCPDNVLAHGLPSPDLIEPTIDPFIREVDLVSALASAYRHLADAADPTDRCMAHLERWSLLRVLGDSKLLLSALRSARLHAPDVHHKIVLSAWLRFERRPDELEAYPSASSSLSAFSCGPALECPSIALVPGFDPGLQTDHCLCRRATGAAEESCDSGSTAPGDDDECDVIFCIGDEEIACARYQIASLSKPLHTMMYGGFMESRREKIYFTNNKISPEAMRAVVAFSRAASLEGLPPDIVLELLIFANKYCCEAFKSACDARLATLVESMEDALLLVEYGLEETAHLLVGSCLQVFLRELPRSLHDPRVLRLLCDPEARQRLAMAGQASFTLYYFLSHVAMAEDMRSNTTVMLLERLGECATCVWQKQLAFHQLGCVMLEREEYEDAQGWFEKAAEAGHVYSLAGVARANYKQGKRYSAFKLLNSLMAGNDRVGWMHQERSLYSSSVEEKMRDLNDATKLDPTLLYPYKYRAVLLTRDEKIGAAVVEMNKVLGFKVSADCLELRAWFSIALEDHAAALRDVRTLLTMDPNYMMFHGKVHGDHLVEVLQQRVHRWSLADCWMQLYDRWSSVDDVGSLAVVHQMLAEDASKSILWFRQSLLLSRLNCQEAAMRSLRLARNHSAHEHERLVYEGWILYDAGYREEALAKAEWSISIQRSFEAFFLKAYASADTSLDNATASHVIHLYEEALKCPSDGLRKGQALNNLGSVYVDCGKLDEAANCYFSALNIRHTRAHQGLARVYYLKDKRKAAYDEMTKLIEKARNNASAYEKRSEYCDHDMAKNDLTRATELDPLRTFAYRYRAAVLMDDRKEEEAIAELSKVISFKPDIHVLYLRAAFHESMGKTAATLRDCEAALFLQPNHEETLELYGKANVGAGSGGNLTPSRSTPH